jgi:nucleoside-diphosphate-sugar epimerase
MPKPTVLLTGATGFVGGLCRRYWGDCYNLVLADNRPMSAAKDTSRVEGDGDIALSAHESFRLLDITSYEQFLSSCQGVDVVVHLAATPGAPDDPDSFSKSLLPLNVVGAYNAFAAASAAGCRRIVFASSVNAVLGYVGNDASGRRPDAGPGAGGGSGAWLPAPDEYTPGQEKYHAAGEGAGAAWDAPVWPCNVCEFGVCGPIARLLPVALTWSALADGATKCWGEALARVFSTSHGLSCVCVRLGGFPAGLNVSEGQDPSPADAVDKASVVACVRALHA